MSTAPVAGREQASLSALSGGLAGGAAMAVGLGGLVYSVAFIAVVVSGSDPAQYVAAAALLIVGLLAVVVAVALFEHLAPADRGVGMCALIFAVASGLGSSIHGGFDLAKLINPPSAGGNFPNPVDPRGMLTFGVASLAVLGWSYLIGRSGSWPRRLARLGYLSALLLAIIYVGRLTAFDPKNPVLLVPAAVEGFLVNPLWFVLVAGRLRRPGGSGP